MKAWDGHYWRDADGRRWSMYSVSDHCQEITPFGVCSLTPDRHPSEPASWQVTASGDEHGAGLLLPVLALVLAVIIAVVMVVSYVVFRGRGG